MNYTWLWISNRVAGNTDYLQETLIPFSVIGDDTITALTTLAAIFKNKFKKPLFPEIKESQIKAAENKRPSVLVHPVITSPVKHNYHIRSHTEVNHTAPANGIESQNSPHLLRVITPAARSAAPLRVPARVHNLSPRNLSQGYFLDMGSANHSISFGNNNWTSLPMINAVLHTTTGKEMQYKDLMKNPIPGTALSKRTGQ
jgi:hypothetical protein